MIIREEELTIENICNGAVPEIFAHAVQEILQNIADPSTELARKRTITLQFAFLPNPDRRGAHVTLMCKLGLAMVEPIQSTIWLSDVGHTIKGHISRDAQQEKLFPPPPAGEAAEESTHTKVVQFSK